jgi:hypothetical protein
MLTREYTRAGHVARFVITRDAREGWEVREEHDERIVRRTNYRDWHRVERAIQAFERQLELLEDPDPA